VILALPDKGVRAPALYVGHGICLLNATPGTSAILSAPGLDAAILDQM
jgi:hypothetical protein